jgi:putative transposase
MVDLLGHLSDRKGEATDRMNLRTRRHRSTLQIVNVLNALAKKEQPEAAERLSAMRYAESRRACEGKRDEFVFDYPQEHWIHLRTTNIVESPFNAVRRRTDASRRFFKKTENAEAMIWNLLLVAQKSWRALNAPKLMRQVYDGKRFKDGIAVRTTMEPIGKAA